MSEMDDFQVVIAQRLAVPILASLSGTSGSGKTFSGLLLASGLADGGKVGMIDAENGRGTLYQDDPDITKALPNSYLYTQISAPYTPIRYVKALRAMEAAGATATLIDSTSHEWEGEGGCCDIAENNKLKGMPNWAMAKREHKRFMAYLLSSRMHIIPCLRAREKVKIQKDVNGKEQVISQGIQPIAEKNFVFEMLASLIFDEASHHYANVKMPKMLTGIFKGGELITRAHGEALLKWSKGGKAVDPNSLLNKRARSSAELGMAGYTEFFASLSKPEKAYLVGQSHDENKKIAAEVDAKAESNDDSFESRLIQAKKHLQWSAVLGSTGYATWDEVKEKDREKVLSEVESELALFA